MEKETAKFTIVYNGPELYNMDVRELGPALLSIGNLIQECDNIINGTNESKLEVKVDSSFRRGSFKIDFYITKVNDQLSLIQNLETYKNLKEILIMIGLIGGASSVVLGSVLHFMRWLKGQRIENKETIDEDEDTLVVKRSNGEKVKVAITIFSLVSNPNVTVSIGNIINSPLSREGITSVHTEDENGELQFKVEKDERESFKRLILKQEIFREDIIEETHLSIIQIRFKKGIKDQRWVFNRGGNNIWATIKDVEFLKKVDINEELFAKNSRLLVKLLERELLINGESKIEYEILKVHEHEKEPLHIQENLF